MSQDTQPSAQPQARANALRAKGPAYTKSHSVATYTIQTLSKMLDETEFEGKRVLEFGGWNIPTDITLGDMGARSWLSVDMIGSLSGAYQARRFPHLADVKIHSYEEGAALVGKDGFHVVDGDATELPEEYYGTFDIVVTIATIEHVLDMVTFLEKAWLALKPGGVLLTRFGPIWPSYIGHHAYVNAEINFQKPDGLFSPWIHLLMRPDEMQQMLRKEGHSTEVIARAVHQVYSSPRINRFFTEDYISFFKNSRFEETRWDPVWAVQPDPDTLKTLEKAFPNAKDFATGAWETVSFKAK